MPPTDRPDTELPTQVVKMKSPAKPGGVPEAPKLAGGTLPTKPSSLTLPRLQGMASKPAPASTPLQPASPSPRPSPTPSRPAPTTARPAPAPPRLASKPPVGVRPAEPPIRLSSELDTDRIEQGTIRATPVPPPARPPESAPRASQAGIIAQTGAIDGPPHSISGTIRGRTEPTAVVKPLPVPERSVSVAAELRRPRLDLGRWLIGGAVAVGALVVAFLSGAFTRSSDADRAAAAPVEQSSPRRLRTTEASELRGPSEPPRTVGNSPSAGATAPTAEPPKQAVAAKAPPVASEPRAEGPKQAAKAPPVASEPRAEAPKQVAAKAPSPAKAAPAESPKQAVAAKAPPAKAAPATKAPPGKPPAQTKPATKPAPRKPPAGTTPPKWDPDSLFPK